MGKTQLALVLQFLVRSQQLLVLMLLLRMPFQLLLVLLLQLLPMRVRLADKLLLCAR